MTQFYFRGLIIMMGVFMMARWTSAQDQDNRVEGRLDAIENYVNNLPSTLNQFSVDLQNSLQTYTRGLETSLQNFSKVLQGGMDERVKISNRSIVILNVNSRTYQRIETNTGTLLIAVDKIETIDNGYKLYLNIGNPNFADYRDFKLKLFWGPTWDDNAKKISYEEWRQSLRGTEFIFQGAINKGMWNPIVVDLVPAKNNRIGYIECQMEVLSVELQAQQNP